MIQPCAFNSYRRTIEEDDQKDVCMEFVAFKFLTPAIIQIISFAIDDPEKLKYFPKERRKMIFENK